jgi:hypothetical protein
MLGKGTRDKIPPIDFNGCVSKNELQKLIREERTFIVEKLNQIMQSINTLWPSGLKILSNDDLNNTVMILMMMMI